MLGGGGFGSGKSIGLVLLAALLTRRYPGIRILIGRAHLPMLNLTTRRDFEEWVPREWIRRSWVSPGRYLFDNGSEVIFRPLKNADEIKGLTLGAALIDEWTEVPERSTEILRTRLRQEGMPGILAGVTNPAGTSHYLYRQFVDLSEREAFGRAYIQSSSLENTNTPEHYRELLVKRNAGADFRRGVLGEWVDPDTVVWDTFDRSRCTGPPPILDRKWEIQLAIDFGFSHWFVCLWVARRKFLIDGREYVRAIVYRDYWNQRGRLEDILRDIRSHVDEDRERGLREPSEVWADPSGVRERYEMRTFPDPNLRMQTRAAQNDVVPGLRSVRSAFLPLPDGWPSLILATTPSVRSTRGHPNLADQVASYRLRDGATREGDVVTHDGSGNSIDDGCDALRYAWFSPEQTRFDRVIGYDPGMGELDRRRVMTL